ncbi:MAG: FHA domain-containing protein, partial [Microcystaceae cyanobacterium]
MHSKQASRKHATLLRKFNSKTNQEVFWIIDGDLDGNKSQNGIYVNGEKCLVRELKDGDLINFGCDINASYHSSANGLTSVGEDEGDYPNFTPVENAVSRQKDLVISEGNLEEMSATEEETFHDDVYLDALTQLPNRTLFLEYIYIAISNARRKKHKAGLLFFNLSNLSEIQRSLGMAIWEQA